MVLQRKSESGYSIGIYIPKWNPCTWNWNRNRRHDFMLESESELELNVPESSHLCSLQTVLLLHCYHVLK